MDTKAIKSEVVDKFLLDLFQSELGYEGTSISDDMDLRDELGMDELDIMETFMAVESEFKFSIPTDEEGKILAVKDLKRVILEGGSLPKGAEYLPCIIDKEADNQNITRTEALIATLGVVFSILIVFAAVLGVISFFEWLNPSK